LSCSLFFFCLPFRFQASRVPRRCSAPHCTGPSCAHCTGPSGAPHCTHVSIRRRSWRVRAEQLALSDGSARPGDCAARPVPGKRRVLRGSRRALFCWFSSDSGDSSDSGRPSGFSFSPGSFLHSSRRLSDGLPDARTWQPRGRAPEHALRSLCGLRGRARQRDSAKRV
jgi:hypothetical protein